MEQICAPMASVDPFSSVGGGLVKIGTVQFVEVVGWDKEGSNFNGCNKTVWIGEREHNSFALKIGENYHKPDPDAIRFVKQHGDIKCGAYIQRDGNAPWVQLLHDASSSGICLHLRGFFPDPKDSFSTATSQGLAYLLRRI